MITKESADRVVELLNEYGKAKFGAEWTPEAARKVIGKGRGDELVGLLAELKAGDTSSFPRLIELFGIYGETLFGDEYWPGKASSWIDDGEELEARLEDDSYEANYAALDRVLSFA